MNRIKIFLSLFFLASTIFFAKAQKAPEKNWNSARILHEIEKLKHVGHVLYVAAHPDDENTQLISYLVNVKGIETAYISLTRGDGGQDLIGPEVREELGVIRTQELLMARSVDGGEQFFTRANDFGFSKTAKEALRIWDSTEVESDLVWVIRKFKPDIIITRFSPTYTKTHGHHQASAILAMKAFDDAANPQKFPEQLKYVEPWQATSLFWNTSPWFYQNNKMDTAGFYHTDIDSYLPLLGKSVADLAAESRSMHKSQGMGTSPRRGDLKEYFVYLKGKKPENRDIFSVANFDWSRIKGGENIESEINTIIKNFNSAAPQESLEELKALFRHLENCRPNYLVGPKMSQIMAIMVQCAGLYVEALSTKEYLSPGDSINISLGVIEQNNAKHIEVKAANLFLSKERIDNSIGTTELKTGQNKTFSFSTVVPDNINITGPYWLENDPSVGMYTVDSLKIRGLPQNPYQMDVLVSFSIDSLNLGQVYPVFYKTVDPVKGEVYYLARIVPPAVANPNTKLLVFSNNNAKELSVKVKSFTKGKAALKLDFPPRWVDSVGNLNLKRAGTEVMSYTDSIYLNGNGTEQIYNFWIQPRPLARDAYVNISVIKDGHTYNRSLEEINYDHIPKQILLPKSEIKVEKIDIKTSNKLIGYINGAGDDIPQCLKEIGYRVETIAPEQLASADLSKYNTIIAGVRAYNTVDRLKYDNQRLIDYVKNGGTYIVQYNNSFRLKTENIGPYPLTLSADRTTEEDSKVTFVHPDNPVLNEPNKITDADFAGWVQERGLYYPNKWDANYEPILEMNDTGEKPTQGALLVAKYGKGYFVYTGLSFFRELPAGVAGAYRLFANLIELGNGTK